MTVTERAAFLAWRLAAGDTWTAAEVARLLGMSYAGAWRLLSKVSRALPIRHHDRKMTVTERAAFGAWQLMRGEQWTTAEAARLLGMSERGARFLLSKISRVLPIHHHNGAWQKLPD